jgi:hypothetical protein
MFIGDFKFYNHPYKNVQPPNLSSGFEALVVQIRSGSFTWLLLMDRLNVRNIL